MATPSPRSAQATLSASGTSLSDCATHPGLLSNAADNVQSSEYIGREAVPLLIGQTKPSLIADTNPRLAAPASS